MGTLASSLRTSPRGTRDVISLWRWEVPFSRDVQTPSRDTTERRRGQRDRHRGRHRDKVNHSLRYIPTLPSLLCPAAPLVSKHRDNGTRHRQLQWQCEIGSKIFCRLNNIRVRSVARGDRRRKCHRRIRKSRELSFWSLVTQSSFARPLEFQPTDSSVAPHKPTGRAGAARSRVAAWMDRWKRVRTHTRSSIACSFLGSAGWPCSNDGERKLRSAVLRSPKSAPLPAATRPCWPRSIYGNISGRVRGKIISRGAG